MINEAQLVWERTPTSRRYMIEGKRHIEVDGKVRKISDLTEKEIDKILHPEGK